MGESLTFRRPVEDVIGPALVNSAKLALLAFIIVVPLAIIGGVYAALNEGTAARQVHLPRAASRPPPCRTSCGPCS